MEGNLAITVFGPTDPDAIASTFAYGQLAEAKGIDYDVLFQSEVDMAENQAFANYMDVDIEELSSEGFQDYENIALIDCGPERLRDVYPDEYIDEIYQKLISVIDHHNIDDDTLDKLDKNDVFHDIRDDYGSASTIIARYLEESEIEVDKKTATALYYGFYTDTESTLNGWIKDDFKSVVSFADRVDQDALSSFIETDMTSAAIGVIHRVTDESLSEQRGVYKYASPGVIEEKDDSSLARAADLLINEEGVDGLVVPAVVVSKEEVTGKVRYSGSRFTAEEIAEKIAEDQGNGGGHPKRAGFTIDPGIVRQNIDKNEAQNALLDSVKEKFFDIVGKSNGE